MIDPASLVFLSNGCSCSYPSPVLPSWVASTLALTTYVVLPDPSAHRLPGLLFEGSLGQQEGSPSTERDIHTHLPLYHTCLDHLITSIEVSRAIRTILCCRVDTYMKLFLRAADESSISDPQPLWEDTFSFTPIDPYRPVYIKGHIER